ncbi:hypothetical protein ACF0H5_006505 [Mactra antiquata]
MEAYKDAAHEPYGYLVLDFSPSSPKFFLGTCGVNIQKMIPLPFDRYQRLISVAKDRDSEFSFENTKDLLCNQSEEDNDFYEEKSEETPR